MMRLYFVCMGNYYRSRLAEELALHYAKQYGLAITADSGGLSKIPNPNHPGNMARATLEYLRNKEVEPQGANREPKNCRREDVYQADIVVFTDQDEQQGLFKEAFPDYAGRIIGWRARDLHFDPWVETPVMIDRHVEALIKELAKR